LLPKTPKPHLIVNKNKMHKKPNRSVQKKVGGGSLFADVEQGCEGKRLSEQEPDSRDQDDG